MKKQKSQGHYFDALILGEILNFQSHLFSVIFVSNSPKSTVPPLRLLQQKFLSGMMLVKKDCIFSYLHELFINW